MNYSIIIKDWTSVRDEANAAEVITPGQFVTKNADGEFKKNATAGAAGPVIVALEDELQGKTIEDDYAIDAPVQGWYARRGAQVLAKVLAGFVPAVGDSVQISATGNLEVLTEAATTGSGTVDTITFPGTPVAQVVDAVHQTDEQSNHRIIVEIL